MARYLTNTPAYIGSGMAAKYLPAGIITIADEEVPGRRWLPLDESAQAALGRIGVKSEIGIVPEPPTPEEPPDTMYETQVPVSRRKGRAAERQ
jgi:hypothetical protein